MIDRRRFLISLAAIASAIPGLDILSRLRKHEPDFIVIDPKVKTRVVTYRIYRLSDKIRIVEGKGIQSS